MYEQFNLSAKNPIISNHKVYGQQLLPGLAYIDLIYQVYKKHHYAFNKLELRHLSIYKPLIVGWDVTIRLGIQCDEASPGIWKIRLEGQNRRNGLEEPEQTLYATAEMHARDQVSYSETLDLGFVKGAANRVLPIQDIYEEYRSQDLVHTGFMKAEGQIYEMDSAAILDLSISREAMASSQEFLFHPALIDGSGVGGGRIYAPSAQEEQRLFLPLSYAVFNASEPLQQRCYTRVQRESVLHKNELMFWTMEFFNGDGKKVGELKNLSTKLVRDAGLIHPERKGSHSSSQITERRKPPRVTSNKQFHIKGADETTPVISIEWFLRQLMADTLNCKVEDIHPESGYYEMGLDSPRLLEIVRAIETSINISLSPTLLFEYTTIAELSSYLEENYASKFKQPEAASVISVPDTASDPEFQSSSKRSFSGSNLSDNPATEGDVAIIGMSGRYPQARNLHEFWRNLQEGKDCISEIPKSRWDWKTMDGIKSAGGKAMSKWGGFIDDPDCFDPKFFRISPREAETMDPQERLFLETCWEAIEDAGYTPKSLVPPRGKNNRRKVGVFAGVMHKDYSLVGAEAASQGEAFPLSLNAGPIANRVSYFCNFHGPSMTVDTLCSSSLTAVHLAMESLKRGESEVALAGGVNLSLHPSKYMTYGLWGMHSSDGYCHTFGEGGDGYVSAEGVAAVLLKPLNKAIQDNDRIYAVIKGSAINHVGTVSGIMVPGPVAQGEVIADCLEQSGINPRTIGYIEAHGTGTSLGDPIEIEGLMKAFELYTRERQYCSIGSVKSNIGHAESAAGVIGLQKAALQIYHKTLVPSLHSEQLNPYIDFEQSPFYVQHTKEEWKQPVTMEGMRKISYPRRAALSSFGATGSNAHMILEEYIGAKVSDTTQANHGQDRPVIVPVSAKNEERLKTYAKEMLDYLLGLPESEPVQQDKEPGFTVGLQGKLKELLADIMHVHEELIELDVPWSEYGVEPVHIRLLKGKIQDEFLVEIDDQEWGQRSTIASVTAHLLNEHPEVMGAPNVETDHDDGPDDQVKRGQNRSIISIEDVAYTLQVGREAMDERVVFVAQDILELIQELQAFLENKELKHGFRGNAKLMKDTAASSSAGDRNKQSVRQWIDEGYWAELAEGWASGMELDWNLLYGESTRPSRISLPTYPFARERYWVPAAGKPIVAAAAEAGIHPLLHKNTSDFTEQRFSSTFRGNEFFLSDHVVGKQKILPGVAYLEIARMAVMESLGSRAEHHTGIRLKNVVWIRPISVGEEYAAVNIRLLPAEHGGIVYEIYSQVQESTNSEPVVHSKGSAELLSAGTKDVLNIEDLKKQCGEQCLSSSQFYEVFHEMGMEYGPAHRGIEKAYVGAGQVLAQLSLPSSVSNTLKEYVLHPSLMDSALQATIAYSMNSGGMPPISVNPVMPFALQELDIRGECTPNMWAWIRNNDKDAKTGLTPKLDIDICDDQGNICVRIKGFSTRVLEGELEVSSRSNSAPQEAMVQTPVGNIHLSPAWEAVPVENGTWQAHDSDHVIYVGGEENRNMIQQMYPRVHFFNMKPADTISEIAAKLEAFGIVDHIVWVAPAGTSTSLEDEKLIERQEYGVIPLFRLIKAFIGLGYSARSLGWTVITLDTQRVNESRKVDPSHAGIHGLVGSMAKEYPSWNIRIIDLEAGSLWPVTEIFTLPADRRGHPWVYRKQQWYRQQLIPLNTTETAESSFRHGGVYVVIGGAGGIGKAWSEYMVRAYGAHVVWIGRRQMDEHMRADLDRIARFGPRPVYISADAADYEELRAAYEKIKQTFSRINGVVHSAMVLSNRSLLDMEEDQFRSGLSAKIDVTVRMAQVFRKEPLDFVMFFSSLIAFIKNPKQSHYASGCSFKDAFAHRLSHEWPCKVKVMNWGYWSSDDASASEDVQQLSRIGMGLIEPEAGMKALERLVSNPIHQMAMITTTKPLIVEGMNPKERIDIRSDSIPSVINKIRDYNSGTADRLQNMNEARSLNKEMISLLSRMLLSELSSMGLLEKDTKSAESKAHTGIIPMYQKWFEESLRVLVQHHYLYQDGDMYKVTDPLSVDKALLWKEWELKKVEWLEDPSLKAWMTLAEELMHALPEILTGKRLATDIMFPNSSMNLVEGIYKNNPVADHFNEVLADTLLAYMEERINEFPAIKIRIIEIGAGTGGTSSRLFQKLKPYNDYIEEYCYTDISKAFLLFAKKEYGPHNPFLTYKILNVDAPVAGSNTPSGEFDIAIATNVLHATRNIRQTLRNTKSVLKKNGLILINELSDNRLFTHLTFGLLEGWWLYEDAPLRIPGSPGLYPETWKDVLESEGYEAVFFPAKESHEWGQQIIAASSNGVVRVKQVPHSDRADAEVKRTSNAKPYDTRDRLGTISTVEEQARVKNVAAKQASTVMTEQMLEDHVKETIIEKLSEALKVNRSEIELEESFADYGLDSIIGVHLVQVLNQALRIELDTTSLFDYSSVKQLTAYILSDHRDAVAGLLGQNLNKAVVSDDNRRDIPELGEAASPSYSSRFIDKASLSGKQAADLVKHEVAPVTPMNKEPIAIIGMSGKYAKSANVNELWTHLSNGAELIGESPRWDLSAHYPKEAQYCDRGGFVENIDQFDPFFFNINGLEASYMDPQQRIFMEECWKALEDSGYAGSRIQGRECGVYVGCLGGAGDYQQLFGDDAPAQAFWGIAGSVIPARIAYYLDLKGPAIAIDTACSSSLVAVHMACQGLWSGETEMALAGGVFIQSTPWYYLSTNKAGMLSTTGHSYTFDERADGFIPGEGAGVLVLKRLQEAIHDGDHIYGVIRGSGMNQDGTTNGITAPSAVSQERLERNVYDTFQIDPGDIQVVEAHGTGTKLGDPIEYQALTKAFRNYTDNKEYCAIGSIKTNIGHAAHAAGVAGIIKVLLSLKHKQIPPTLNFETGNSNIQFKDSPFYVNTSLRNWEKGRSGKRRAAVSSFGFSGTNAHIVIEEGPEPTGRHTDKPGYLIVLSARTPEQLRKQANQLLDYCQDDRQADCGNLSYTLLAGRKHFNNRLACVVRSLDELTIFLGKWLARSKVPQVYISELNENDRREQPSLKRYGNQCIKECHSVEPTEYMERLTTIAELYIQGYGLDYEALFTNERYTIISLPTYPFATERYWVPDEKSKGSSSIESAPHGQAMLHPLLHQNTSDLSGVRYSSTFNRGEPLLASTDVSGRNIFSGMIYLEMARKAAELSRGVFFDPPEVIQIKDVVWSQPVEFVQEDLQLHIDIFPDEGDLSYEIYSTVDKNSIDPVIHNQGRVSTTALQSAASRADMSLVQAQCNVKYFSKFDWYKGYVEAGIIHSPQQQVVEEMFIGHHQLLAKLSMHSAFRASSHHFILHPSLTEAAMQATLGLLPDWDEQMGSGIVGSAQPLSLQEVHMIGKPTPLSWVHVRNSAYGVQGTNIKVDIDFYDHHGALYATMRGLTARLESNGQHTVKHAKVGGGLQI
ncbi:SDR family NAD(P)-dependent oxidoreductase [Paenibacillus lautus]|uniref:SDR family NAD(P)-dependent oxidoreductase n=1 Tax=Paenibacillus lautus TaxID=1401 RepID=UPI001FEAB667|nr:SDR family NAD(P)-dependent oxidoreductase [Paenibacillus lautus]